MTLGWRVGLVVAAASSGVLLAFGMGMGRPFQALNLALHPLIPLKDPPEGFHLAATAGGFAVLTLASVIWATLFAAAALRFRWKLRGLVAGAAGFTTAAFLLVHLALPRMLRPGYDAILTTGQLVVLHLAVAGCLVFGMRLALLPSR